MNLLRKSLVLRTFRINQRFCSSTANKFKLTFASGDKKIYDSTYVSQVDVSSTDGDFGILKNHVPVMVELLPGVVTVKNDMNVDHFFISSGFVSGISFAAFFYFRIFKLIFF